MINDIIDYAQEDTDTADENTLDELFEKKYKLLAETAITGKKSYVNKIHGTKSLRIAVGIPDNNSIEIFDVNKSTLTSLCRLSGHLTALTELVFSPKEDHLLYSAGHDGIIKLWDLRTSGSCVQEYKDEEDEVLKPYECMDISCNGKVLCAGSQLVNDDAFLVFWDQRTPTPLGGYWNTHTDDITQVKFHKEKTEILATGSLDGLLNVFNVLEQNEEDALTFSMNVENSVEKITWLDSKQAACATQSNDLQVWDTSTGDRVKSFSRPKIAKSIKRSKEDDCYLVDTYTADDNSHVLLAGSNGGEGNVLRSVTITEKKLQPRTNFTQNKQIVRCCWYDKDRDILVTGGEAGVVSVWGVGDHSSAKTPAKKASGRYKPY